MFEDCKHPHGDQKPDYGIKKSRWKGLFEVFGRYKCIRKAISDNSMKSGGQKTSDSLELGDQELKESRG